MNTLSIIVKSFTRDFMKTHGFLVFKDRELIVESDKASDKDSSIYRFKIGDGVTPYENLNYVSSLYSIFPNIKLFDKNYNNEIDIKLGGDTDVSG